MSDISDLIDSVSSGRLPMDLRLVLYEAMFPEILRRPNKPLEGVDVADMPPCESKVYDNEEQRWRPGQSDCQCFACRQRRSSRVRNFVRSPIHNYPILWREAMKLYKQNVNFVYNPSQEYPYRTARVLDNFISAFGTIQDPNAGVGIRYLTVNMSWDCKFAKEVSDAAKAYRDGLTTTVPLDLDDRETVAHLREDTFTIVRLMTIFRHYKTKVTLTFPNVSEARRAFVERIYAVRKAKDPKPDEDGNIVPWWRDNPVDLFCYDRIVQELYRDNEIRRLFLQAFDDEKAMLVAHRDKWDDQYLEWIERDEWDTTYKIGHLTIDVDFSGQ